MKHIRRPALFVGAISIAAVVVGTGSYALASSGGSPLAGLPPTITVDGKVLPNQSVPHGSNGIPRPPEPQLAPVASPASEPGDNQILSAAAITSEGLPLPIFTQTLTLTTAYFTVRQDDRIGLYAGADATSPADGLVVIYDQPADASAAPFAASGPVSLPGSGPLTITSVNGGIAILVDAAGHQHALNLQTHAFSG